jgi:heterodisulfide reductase subunit C
MAQIIINLTPEEMEKLEKINELSGENVHQCMQCGTCSAVCPMGESMDLTPRQVMHMLQFGLTDELIAEAAGAACASCHTCTVRCARGIDLAKVFEALRLLTTRNNEDFVKVSEVSKEVLEEAPQIVFVSGFRKLTA